LYIAAVAIGMSLFFTGGEQALVTAPDPARGNVYALASGFTYALMLVGLRWLGRRGDHDAGLATVAAGNLLAFTFALAPALPVTTFDAASAGVILYLGIAQVGLAYWCLTRGIRHVPAFEAITTLQLEVAMNPVWTWLVHGERPGARSITGGAIIVCATLLNTWRQQAYGRSQGVLKMKQG
jgi:drug/metabolite transporter (DMT)-like permease